jgi:rRNA maturation endonuclease Nob1
MIEFKYKCPICRAANNLSRDNTICRRCGSSLKRIYELRKNKIYRTIKIIGNNSITAL